MSSPCRSASGVAERLSLVTSARWSSAERSSSRVTISCRSLEGCEGGTVTQREIAVPHMACHADVLWHLVKARREDDGEPVSSPSTTLVCNAVFCSSNESSASGLNFIWTGSPIGSGGTPAWKPRRSAGVTMGFVEAEIMDNGFRNPDLGLNEAHRHACRSAWLQAAVPPAPMLTSLFQAGRGPGAD